MPSLLARLLTDEFQARIRWYRALLPPVTAGVCPKCGGEGPAGTRCDDCGCADYK